MTSHWKGLLYGTMLRLRIRIHMFLSLLDPDLDPSIIMQK
jgi:hypothetical protein